MWEMWNRMLASTSVVQRLSGAWWGPWLNIWLLHLPVVQLKAGGVANDDSYIFSCRNLVCVKAERACADWRMLHAHN
jgi:hypothetical protein